MPHALSASTDMFSAFKADPRPVTLACGIQHYDWGQSGPHAFIPRLLGTDPAPGRAYAELWIGDHPSLPARAVLADGAAGLPELIAAAPAEVLGEEARRRFGDRLPFLVKVLAAARSLSIQAHPDAARAKTGFAREEAAGVPRAAPHRHYKDANHKPELLLALTPFWGLKGFRPLAEVKAALSAEAPELAFLLQARPEAPVGAGGRETRDSLAALYGAAMTLPQSDVNRTLSSLSARLRREGPFPPERREHWFLRAEGDHCPGPEKDRGLFSFYFLNLARLAPGQALFLAPGELHCYLEGVGVEVMASSDNVLRGGLTSKHVDIPELLGAITVQGGPAEVLSPGADGLYRAAAREFEAARVLLPAGGSLRRTAARGVDLWLATEGEGEISAAGRGTPLRAGSPVLVPCAVGAYEVRSSPGILLHRVSTP